MAGAFNESLELLWGVEERLNSLGLAEAVIRLPWGLTVVELIDKDLLLKGGNLLYFSYKVGLDSIRLAREAKRLLGARAVYLFGLKDARAVTYQYLLVEPGEGRAEDRVSRGRLSLWLVGRVEVPRSQVLLGNRFRLELETRRPELACSNLASLEYVPAFYGPQRFGFERPNNHLVGLYQASGRFGELLRELGYRYPLERRSRAGWFEGRLVEGARLRADPHYAAGRLPRIVAQALQSYIYNRCLSEAIRSGNLREFSEGESTVYCGRRQYRVPSARLPGPRLAGSRSRWARLAERVAEEEGIKLEDLKGLSSPLRPLIHPVCGKKCRQSHWGATLYFTLPRGGYATVLAREIALVDWEYSASDTAS